MDVLMNRNQEDVVAENVDTFRPLFHSLKALVGEGSVEEGVKCVYLCQKTANSTKNLHFLEENFVS